MPADNAVVSRAVLGGADGATSLVGVLAGLLAAHAGSTTILAVTAGGAVAAAVGMASGDYLSGASARLVAVMGAATLAGSLVPALPVTPLPGWRGVAAAAVLLPALGVTIAEVRAPQQGRLRAYLVTGGILAAASAPATVVALTVGAAGV